jgi:acyl-coenzyme A synthetase/AMP-(fatty) acid ligase
LNILDPILLQCRFQPDALALCAPGTSLNIVSYGRMERLLNTMARRAQALGLAKGNVVAVVVDDDILHAILTLALMRLGIVTLSSRSLMFPAGLRLDAVVTDQPFSAGAAPVRLIPFDSSWTAGDGTPIENPPDVQADDLCRITLTSGTTGDPKTIGLTYRMAADRIARHDYIYGPLAPQCSRMFCDLGLTINLGFLFLIQMLSRGGVFMFRGANAEVTLQAFELYKIQCLVMSPAALGEFVDYYERFPTHQGNVQLILSGGSLISRALADRVRSRICSNLVTFYGATEVHGIAAATVQAIEGISGAVGYVLPWMAIEAVDQSGRPLPRGQEGLLRIRGPFSIAGYMGDAAASGDVFRDGWFYPGDLGTVTPEGLLIIGGREKSVLNLGGDKINPELVEHVLTAAPGVADAAAFAIPNALGIDELWAAIVWRGTAANESTLQGHCRVNLPARFQPVHYVTVPAIPRNQFGKVERRRLPDLCAQGTRRD